jgi:uncharacterized protein with PQ loop repeat
MTALATGAALYGIAGSFSSLLQAGVLVRAGSAREILIPFIAILTGGHAIWLTYGIGIANLPLIVTDSVGLCCGPVTCITAVRLSRRHLPREAMLTPRERLL